MKIGLRFYQLVIAASRLIGVWFVDGFARMVSVGYYVLLPDRRRTSIEFYRALFPSEPTARLALRTWRQYSHFAGTYADRIRLARGIATYERDGAQRVDDAVAAGTGGILLMSHFGDWEVAARMFASRGYRLLLYVGTKQKEQIETMQKGDMLQSGIEIATATEGDASGLELLDAVQMLRSGGLVSIAGDRVWTRGQRRVEAEFLGRPVPVPAAPFALAMTTGAPLFPFFVVRQGPGRFHVTVHPPIPVEPKSRTDREEALQDAARQYLALLERYLRQHPEHWYHFEPWLGAEDPGGS